MAKVTAPLLSMEASGQIGKTQVYAKWKGVQYGRRYVVPANPKSSAQSATRTVFYWLTQVWKLLDANVQVAWTAYASGKPLTNRNAFIGQNVKALRTMTDLADMIGSPGAGGGLAPTSISVAVATLALTVTLGEPSLPTGWTIASSECFAILDENPSSSVVFDSYAVQNAVSPYHGVIDVPAAGTYRVFGFYVFNKPNGAKAYGVALNTTAVAT
jgi:hypothetical protein